MIDEHLRPEPQGDLEKFWVGETKDEFTFVNRNLPYRLKGPLIEAIQANIDHFSWTPVDMPGIDLDFMSHRLAVRSEVQPVVQKKRKISSKRENKVAKQRTSLLEVGFIRELDYSTWLSNVVLVKKANGKWRMCVDYSDLNKACPKN
ncbi:uncharacterized protein [Arachis hypogaea]|uniref:uncharacterized protein n=1 Tax=Arachis hypogaea TaxID=3818 RepID=UPI003B227284